ncbi:hypothetical protein LOK49_LG13G00050 [Camellia lanceoleosa]|uniref:Uncharacterized protein n=1 Tax=Camellia lanceoleosa TaxID=1840588 RepID=A0ACC0FLG5_9ERIC|nr:hypothetical protein LOK49_LG13G00050 [Camellia lanceoleosa]
MVARDCFFYRSIAVSLESWLDEKHSRANVIASNGGWVSICDLPFSFWTNTVFEWIGMKCGGLLEVDSRTKSFRNLFEARLKVKGIGNGFLSTTIDVQVEGVSAVPIIREDLSIEKAQLGLNDIVDRSCRDFQSFNAVAEDLLEIILASEKMVQDLEEGRFDTHEVLQALEEYGSSESSDSQTEGDSMEDEQVDQDWVLNNLFNADCTTDGEDIEARVGDSSIHSFGLICPVLQISSRDIHEQGVNIDTLRAIMNESTVVSESLQANCIQGHMYDNQGGISGNHVDKEGQVFSNRVKETESWLKELSMRLAQLRRRRCLVLCSYFKLWACL